MKTVRPKRLLLKTSLAIAVALLIASGASAQEEAALAKIHPWVFENTRAGAQAEFFVVLKNQADLSGAAKLKGKLAKGQLVYRELFRTARETQKPIVAELEAQGVEYRSFYLVNAILVKGDRSLAQRLAARPDVKRIDGNPEMRETVPEPREPEPLEFNPDWPDLITGKAITAAEPALILEAASEPATLDEIVARVAEAAGIDRPGEELAGKVRGQLRELYGGDLVGVRWTG